MGIIQITEQYRQEGGRRFRAENRQVESEYTASCLRGPVKLFRGKTALRSHQDQRRGRKIQAAVGNGKSSGMGHDATPALSFQ
jgi:hypothetical protein